MKRREGNQGSAMNRRDFLGTVFAGVSALQIPGLAQFSATEPAESMPRAQWLKNGLIDAGGSHEPYIFLVRRGGERTDIHEIYEGAQSDEVIRRLKGEGIEVFHTHLYKGFGMAAEKPEMEEAKRATEIAHRHGMKVDTYIQWNSMMYETFFAEEPRAKDWIQRDIDGRPILLTYGYQQSFRYRPCFANQEYLEYLKKIVKYAVEEVKTDFIHFDNFDLNPEPDSCHCPACVLGFRNFLKAKYSAEKRRERFGFENIDFVNPPQWNRQNLPEKMEILFDPAIQEWVDYRCQLMADALRQMALYAKSLDPEVAIEINPHGITGGNRAWENGIDHARLLRWTEVFWTEEENPPSYLPDGRLISKIRSYKLARAFQNILLTYISNDPVAMAECLSFNQTIGYAGEDPIPAEMLKYVGFYRQNRNLYVGADDAGTVAVLRSYPSITYHNARAQLSAVLVEQALIQGRIPFDLVFDQHLNDLSKYRVLILPDSECLSDEQLALIRRFVADGGGLLATGQAGLYDKWRQLRIEPGLRGLVDHQPPATAYEESVGATAVTVGPPLRKEYGKGRVAYLPTLEFNGPLPSPEPYFSVNNRFWKLPKNWQEIIEATGWAAKGDIPMSVSGPLFLAANLVRQPDKQRVLVHLVNYNAKNVPSVQTVNVRCRLPEGKNAREVKVYSPDSVAPNTLKFNTQASRVSFTVPQVKTYTVATVSW